MERAIRAAEAAEAAEPPATEEDPPADGGEPAAGEESEPTAEEQTATLESDRYAELALEKQRYAQLEQQLQAQRQSELAELQSKQTGAEKALRVQELIEAGEIIEALSLMGSSVEDVNMRVLRGEAPKEPVKSKQEIEIQQLKEMFLKQQQEAAARHQSQQLQEGLGYIIDSVPADKYPLLTAIPDWQSEVFEGMKIVAKQVGYTGGELPFGPEDVAAKLENHIYEQTLERAKLSPKLRELLGTSVNESQPSQSEEENAPATATTLTNRDSSEVGRRGIGATKAECIANAIKAAEQLG
jgi:hypothetical protein